MNYVWILTVPLCGKRVVSSKGSRPETIMAVQDITMQAQALLSIKDSNKVCMNTVYYLQYRVDNLCLVQLLFGMMYVCAG